MTPILPTLAYLEKNNRSHPVKLTALEYIREAIQDERYEELIDMVAVAREFGAEESEIATLLQGGGP